MSGSALLRTLVQSQRRILPFAFSSKVSMCKRVQPSVPAVHFVSTTRNFSGSRILNADMYFTKSHDWIKVEDDKGTIGITHYAQKELGDIVFCELPEVGDTFEQEDAFAVIESVKAASDIFMPVAGEITETNAEVVDNPATINSSPLEQGWLVKIKISDASQLEGLLDENTYKDLVATAEADE